MVEFWIPSPDQTMLQEVEPSGREMVREKRKTGNMRRSERIQVERETSRATIGVLSRGELMGWQTAR